MSDESMTTGNEENKRTVEEYWDKKKVWKDFVGRASGRRIEWLEKDLERAVSGLDKSSKIFEFGSGTGEEAKYLRKLGYQVEMSDVTQNSVDFLRESGLKSNNPVEYLSELKSLSFV